MWCGAEGESLALDQNDLLVHLVAFHYWDAIHWAKQWLVRAPNEVRVQLSVHKCPDFFPLGRADRVPGPRLTRQWGEEDACQRAYWEPSQRWLCVHACVSLWVCVCIFECDYMWVCYVFMNLVKAHLSFQSQESHTCLLLWQKHMMSSGPLDVVDSLLLCSPWKAFK